MVDLLHPRTYRREKFKEVIVALAAVGVGFIVGRRHPHGVWAANRIRRVLYYVDPMHPAYSLLLHRTTYHFCSNDCKKNFQKEPERYLASNH